MALQSKKSKGKAEPKAPKVSRKAKAEMDRPFVAVLPRVNLLSAEVREVIEEARLKRLMLILAACTVAAVAAAWLGQAGMIASAEKKLAAEKNKTTQLTAQVTALTPIKTYYDQVKANSYTIQTTMAKEILTSDVLDAIKEATPDAVKISTYSLSFDTAADAAAGGTSEPATTAASCPSQDPYNAGAPLAGCLTVDGTASSRAQLGKFLDKVEAHKAFTVAFIPTTVADAESGQVTFSATIGLDASEVYKNRYAELGAAKAGN